MTSMIDKVFADMDAEAKRKNSAGKRPSLADQVFAKMDAPPKLQEGRDFTIDPIAPPRADGIDFSGLTLVPRHRLAGAVDWSRQDPTGLTPSPEQLQQEYLATIEDPADRKIAEKGPIGAVEFIKRYDAVRGRWATKVPGFGMFASLGRVAQLKDADARMQGYAQEYEAVTQEIEEWDRLAKEVGSYDHAFDPEAERIKWLVDRQENLEDWIGDIGEGFQEITDWNKEMQLRKLGPDAVIYEGITQLGSFIGEFVVAGGLAKYGSGAAKAMTKRLMRKYGETKGRRLAVRAFGAGSEIALSGITRTLHPIQAARAAAEGLEQATEAGIKIDDKGAVTLDVKGKAILEKSLRALAERAIENASEVAGESLVAGFSRVLKRTPIVGGFVRGLNKFVKKRYPKGKAKQVLKEVGLAGPVGEWLEEDFGGFMRAVFNPQGEDAALIDRLARLPAESLDPENMLVRAVILSVPMLGRSALIGGARAVERRQVRKGKVAEQRDAILAGGVKTEEELAREVGQDFIGRVVDDSFSRGVGIAEAAQAVQAGQELEKPRDTQDAERVLRPEPERKEAGRAVQVPKVGREAAEAEGAARPREEVGEPQNVAALKSLDAAVDQAMKGLPKDTTLTSVRNTIYEVIGVPPPGLGADFRIGSTRLEPDRVIDLSDPKQRAKLARTIFKAQAESEGLDPSGILGPMSGFTAAGKLARGKDAAARANKILDAIGDAIQEIGTGEAAIKEGAKALTEQPKPPKLAPEPPRLPEKPSKPPTTPPKRQPPTAPTGQATAAAAAGGFGTIGQSEQKPTAPGDDHHPPRQRGAKAPTPDPMADIRPGRAAAALDSVLQIVSPAHRSEQSREGARVLRGHLGRVYQAGVVAHEELRKVHSAFVFMRRSDVAEFIDRMETGKPQKTPKLEAINKKMRKLLEQARGEVQALGKGKLETYYKNYFPHIWKDDKRAGSVVGSILGKKRLGGPQSFLKKRTIMTVKEGVAAGLELVSPNPVDVVLLKLHEMRRYVMMERIIADLRGRNLLKFVYSRSQAPEGMARINDKSFTVFMPPVIEISEAFDHHMVDNLMSFAESIGIKHQRLMKLRGRAWGKALGKDQALTKFGGPESVVMHEIGHILGNRYGLYNWMRRTEEGQSRRITRGKRAGQTKFVPTKEAVAHRKKIDAEWRALADARFEGLQAKPAFRNYVRRRAEKEAVLLEAFIHAPDMMKDIAPTITKLFTDFLNARAELRPLLDIKPSLVLGSQKGKLPIPGVTIQGHYYVPEQVALLINNYLSPGLRNSENALIGSGYNMLRKLGNAMNQANLSLSAFHGFNTTTDVMSSHMGLGMRQILATPGQRLRGIGTALSAPISPVLNLWRGRNLMRAYRQEIATIPDPRMRALVSSLVLAGGRSRLDSFYYNSGAEALTRTISDMVRGTAKEKLKAGVRLPVNMVGAMLDALAAPLMKWLVPHQKLGLFSIMATHEMDRAQRGDLTDEQLHERLTSVWDSVDNRMGQLVYDNLFWNKVPKDGLMLGVRSIGWNLGSWREFAGAGIDILTTRQRVARGDVWLSHKMGYVAGAAMVYATLGATIMYVLTGRPPDELKDYFFPKTGFDNADGSPERISLPTYAKDWYSYSQRPFTTVEHKLHPLWPMLAETWENQDFYGVEIRNAKDPAVEQMIDLAEHFGESFIPFSVRNYNRMVKTGHNPARAAITSVTGITKAPAYVTRSPAQKLMYVYIIERLPQGSRTQEQFDRSRLRKQLIDEMRAGVRINITDYPMFTRSQWKSMSKAAEQPPFAAMFKRLSLDKALNVYAISSAAEKKQVIAILGDKAKRAGKRGTRPNLTEELRLFQELTKSGNGKTTKG